VHQVVAQGVDLLLGVAVEQLAGRGGCASSLKSQAGHPGAVEQRLRFFSQERSSLDGGDPSPAEVRGALPGSWPGRSSPSDMQLPADPESWSATGASEELTSLQSRAVKLLSKGSFAPARIGQRGPNLLLAKDRLRPDWIVPWLKNPQALLDGTRMPSSGTSATRRTHLASKLFNGDAKQQIDALRDYLMHLELKARPRRRPR